MTCEPAVRVLIVDDEERVRHTLGRVISHRLSPDRQVSIDTAADVASALERLERTVYDLVVTDYRMPGGNGSELLAVVERRWPQTRRVLMSGYGDIDDRLDSERATAVQCVVGKPWETATLVAAIRGLLWPGR